MEELNKLKDYATENSVPIMFDEGIEFIVNYIKNNDVYIILKVILDILKIIYYSIYKLKTLKN